MTLNWIVQNKATWVYERKGNVNFLASSWVSKGHTKKWVKLTHWIAKVIELGENKQTLACHKISNAQNWFDKKQLLITILLEMMLQCIQKCEHVYVDAPQSWAKEWTCKGTCPGYQVPMWHIHLCWRYYFAFYTLFWWISLTDVLQIYKEFSHTQGKS